MNHTASNDRALPVPALPDPIHDIQKGRSMQATAAIQATRRIMTGRRRALFPTFAVTAWSTKYLIELGLTHTTGPEVYGVLVAAVAVGAGICSLALLASARGRLFATAAVVVLWAVIAIGGVAGTAAHLVGPDPAHGPVDPRPRPPAAPLVFTALGLVGGGALIYGQRARARARQPEGDEGNV